MEKNWEKERKKFHREVLAAFPQADMAIIDKAFDFGKDAHKNQRRWSGEPYFIHCVEVATIIAQLRLDVISIIASLLHDVVEDTGVSIEDVREEFGEEVAHIVDGETKISSVTADKGEIRQAENFRKMLLSMVSDIRVILIKFADRLHNMRTIEHLPQRKQEQISRETLEVYAPLAHRLGIARIKLELEDLAFKVLEPDAYRYLVRKVRDKKSDRDAYIDRVKDPLGKALKKAGIHASIYGRSKSFFSIFKKIKDRGVPFEEIYDLLAVRIICDNIESCYHTLGIVHTIFPPIPERFKDYIATPKLNGYQSIHTTVIGPLGRMLEIQIRTKSMHRTAEIGIAAHWRYKEGRKKAERVDRQLDWLKTILDFQDDSGDPRELLEDLKIDLFQDEVFVFTPRGDLIKLPQGATPIDFAFAVHSDVGFHCIGSKIGGRIVPLNTPLKSGDSVEIITSTNQHPNQNWIKFVKTAKARGHIKRWLKKTLRDQSAKLGEELLQKELKEIRADMPAGKLGEAARTLGFATLQDLFVSIGQGDSTVKSVVRRLFPEMTEERKPEAVTDKIQKRLKGSPYGVRVQGIDNLLIQFAGCCQPVPGDKITGFLTRGKGVTVHRNDCPNLPQLLEEPERKIDVTWDVTDGKRFLVGIRVLGEDRRNFLRDITEAISSSDVNILSGSLKVEDTIATNTFLLEVKDSDHLISITRNLLKVKGVITVDRFSGSGEI